MTEEELKETVSLLRKPAGKKYLAVQPVVLQERATPARAWRPKLATDMMGRLREEMKKKGYDSERRRRTAPGKVRR